VLVGIQRWCAWCRWRIGDLDFGNDTLGEGDANRIDVDGGGADWINGDEEVLRSEGIGVENTGGPAVLMMACL
jgi:hypothetical protein